MKGDYLSGDATFMQRLLVGWKSSGVKLVPFGKSRRTMFAVKRYERGSTLVAFTASIFDAGCAQGYFTATTLMLVTFGGFTSSSTTDENDYRTPRNKLTQ